MCKYPSTIWDHWATAANVYLTAAHSAVNTSKYIQTLHSIQYPKILIYIILAFLPNNFIRDPRSWNFDNFPQKEVSDNFEAKAIEEVKKFLSPEKTVIHEVLRIRSWRRCAVSVEAEATKSFNSKVNFLISNMYYFS